MKMTKIRYGLPFIWFPLADFNLGLHTEYKNITVRYVAIYWLLFTFCFENPKVEAFTYGVSQ